MIPYARSRRQSNKKTRTGFPQVKRVRVVMVRDWPSRMPIRAGSGLLAFVLGFGSFLFGRFLVAFAFLFLGFAKGHALGGEVHGQDAVI